MPRDNRGRFLADPNDYGTDPKWLGHNQRERGRNVAKEIKAMGGAPRDKEFKLKWRRSQRRIKQAYQKVEHNDNRLPNDPMLLLGNWEKRLMHHLYDQLCQEADEHLLACAIG